MNFRLVAVAGPCAGSTFPLPGPEFSIGRGPSNDLFLRTPSVSRSHCVIRRTEDDLRITDCGSRQRTYVNGLPVQESALRVGDRIAVCDSEFIVSVFRGDEDAPPEVELYDGAIDGATLVERDAGDTLFLKADSLGEAASSDRRAAKGVEALLRIASVVNTIRPPEELQRRVLGLILDTVRAQRGAVLLFDETSEEPRSTICVSRRPRRAAGEAISRTLVRRVLRFDKAVLSNNVPDEAAFQSSESISGSEVHAVLCVGLRAFGKPRGVIYLDSDDPVDRFDDHDLQLLMAIADIAAVALENSRHIEWLENETRRLEVDLGVRANMVGDGPRMREIARFVSKVAPTNTTVLIRGETGTGKEVVARALHANSPRAAKPFSAMNCAALAESLLESELFGHEKGAFSGAVVQKKGRIEVAEGGTLFLDEVGEISPPLQAKLLRVLQEREFERVGSTRTLKANVRVLAATNRDLEKEVKTGAFRQDLYYRLNVVAVTMPPLRERREDIPLLVDHFVAILSAQLGRRVIAVDREARELLSRYDWPGNVRELQNAIERAVVLSDAEILRADDFPEALHEHSLNEPSLGRYQRSVNELKRQLIVSAVREADGNLAAAARALGLHANYLHRLIRNMDLKGMLGR